MKESFEKSEHKLDNASGGFGFHFVVAEWHSIHNLICLFKTPSQFGFDGVDVDLTQADKWQLKLDGFMSNEELISSEERTALYDFFITGYKVKHMYNPFNNWLLFNMPDKTESDESLIDEYLESIKAAKAKDTYCEGNSAYDGWNFSAFKPSPLTYKMQIRGYWEHITKYMETESETDLTNFNVYGSYSLGRELIKEMTKLIYLPYLYGHSSTHIASVYTKFYD